MESLLQKIGGYLKMHWGSKSSKARSFLRDAEATSLSLVWINLLDILASVVRDPKQMREVPFTLTYIIHAVVDNGALETSSDQVGEIRYVIRNTHCRVSTFLTPI